VIAQQTGEASPASGSGSSVSDYATVPKTDSAECVPMLDQQTAAVQQERLSSYGIR
jgi:hypothetical protein